MPARQRRPSPRSAVPEALRHHGVYPFFQPSPSFLPLSLFPAARRPAQPRAQPAGTGLGPLISPRLAASFLIQPNERTENQPGGYFACKLTVKKNFPIP